MTSLLTLVVAIMHLVGYVIGVREGAEFTTGKAILTGIAAVIVNFIIIFVIGGGILSLVVAALAIAG